MQVNMTSLDIVLDMLHQAMDELFVIERENAGQFPCESHIFEGRLKEKYYRAKERIEEFQTLVQRVGNIVLSFTNQHYNPKWYYKNI